MPLETPEQADALQPPPGQRLPARATRRRAPVRPGQLHVAVIGAGATGTELAAELHRTVRAVVAYGLDRIQTRNATSISC